MDDLIVRIKGDTSDFEASLDRAIGKVRVLNMVLSECQKLREGLTEALKAISLEPPPPGITPTPNSTKPI